MNFQTDFLNLPFSLTFSGEALADFLFFIVAGLTAVFSLILFFHWRKYGLGSAVLAITELVYLVGAAVLLFIAFLSLN